MQSFYRDNAESALKALGSGRGGLSEEEADNRINKFGRNALKQPKSGGILKLFFSQFKDVMTLLLVAAAVVSAVIAFFSGDRNDVTDTFIIIFIIFLNALVGCIQQYRADKAIENLKKLSATTIKVRRGGREKQINSELVTVGDVVLLEEGDVVPADCRVISCAALKCDESAMTGESVSVAKTADAIDGEVKHVSDKRNTLFSSTFVVSGSAEAVVCAVGMDTEIGKIAGMLEEEKPESTPLEKSLNMLGKAISLFVLGVTVIIFVAGLIAGTTGILKNFMTAVAVAVAAIPEGLPAVVTIIMAMGVTRMSKKHVVIRKLKSVETLGGCNFICTDKTGTLTENKMKVVEVWLSGEGEECRKKLAECMRVCNAVKGERGAYMGDPTEIALMNYTDLSGRIIQFERIAEAPFDSTRKMMTVAAEIGGVKENFVKGAPDVMIKYCTHILADGGVRTITEEDKRRIAAENASLSERALRVLGFACRAYDGSLAEEHLTFIGLCGMEDPIKKGVKEAVAQCRSAGIHTVMITGDHAATAFAVAKRLGIARDMSEVISGGELDALSPAKRREAIERCRVFARVTPKHKNMIVKALKSGGNVVAMTGDGINDAPSIKSADIGIAMGISGTEVTKSASDMVITDDNFATIVSAVAEGRRIFSNIKKTIRFFIATNLAEVLAILIAAIAFAGKSFLLSTQLLWLNLITDSLPVLALGTERGEKNIMNRPPERAEASMFSKKSVFTVGFFGGYITLAIVAAFALSLALWDNAVATTVTFLALSFAELFHAFNVRTEEGFALGKGFASNKILLLTVALGIALNVILCVVPFFAEAFGLVALNGVQWLIVAGVSLSVIPVGDLYKLLFRKKLRRAGGVRREAGFARGKRAAAK